MDVSAFPLEPDRTIARHTTPVCLTGAVYSGCRCCRDAKMTRGPFGSLGLSRNPASNPHRPTRRVARAPRCERRAPVTERRLIVGTRVTHELSRRLQGEQL